MSCTAERELFNERKGPASKAGERLVVFEDTKIICVLLTEESDASVRGIQNTLAEWGLPSE